LLLAHQIVEDVFAKLFPALFMYFSVCFTQISRTIDVENRSIFRGKNKKLVADSMIFLRKFGEVFFTHALTVCQ
jgi:hypothetical protein